MFKKKKLSNNQLLNTFKAHRRYNNIMFVICIVITIMFLCIGVVFLDSSLSNFICSCAVGLSCGYITGWISSYFADKQTACLLELDYKIGVVDEFIKKCDFEINLFSYNSRQTPQKINIYNLGLAENSQNYFACLGRMGGVFKEISECDIWNFSEIEVAFYFDDTTFKKIKLGEFNDCLNNYCLEKVSKDNKINLSPQQCNNMFSNSITIKYELDKVQTSLIKQKENIILKRKY